MRKSKHRFAAVVAATAMVAAGAAACGGTGGSGGKTTLTFWTHTHPPMIKLNKKLIAAYEKKHPNVRIEYQTIPNTQFGTKMLTALSNGTGPDIINMDDGALRGEYIPKKLVAPIDPKAFGAKSVADLKSRYVPHAIDGAKGTDGTLYGVPSELDATAFVINTKHFTDAGLDPNKPPKTWDDVVSDGKKLVAAGHKQAFNFSYIHSGWYMTDYQTLLAQTGGALANQGCSKATADQPRSVQAMQMWAEMARESGIANPNTASREATAPFTDLATGKQSMALAWPWSMEQIKESNPKTYKQLKVVPLPQVNPDDPVVRWYGYDWAVNSASENKTEAWKFISFLSSHPQQWLSDVGFFQGRKGWENTEAGKSIDFAPAWSKAYTNGKFDHVCQHWSEVKDQLKDAVDKVVFDGADPQKALDKANAQMQTSIG